VRLVHGESLLRVEGDCGAVLDLEAGRGAVESGDAVAAVDVLLRLSLSTCTVENGWVLFHAAAVALKSGGCALLLGHSGAGKSTAARTFGSFCDEWVLARPGVSGVEAASTPYWNGKPGGANCEAMICLGRSSQPRVDRLRGGEGIRALLPHVVRFVRREAADRALLCTLGNLVERVPVFRAQAVIGPGFAEWLRAEMGRLGLAPERGEKPA
jgi:hypothetical protein